ncbi:glycoside hydrolase family 25 protein [Corynebacterium sp. H78]|uniref:glycoside hydrolase family 25 protein n=1 Tax=Corynebacterium sp. H78 TaxID=3133417 RepID=UPI0030ACA3F0
MKFRQSRRTAGTIAALAAALPLTFTTLTVVPAYALDSSAPTGVDVSKWQRPGGSSIDWKRVAASGEKFAFIKATDGVEGESPYFRADTEAAAKAGLIIGSYHKAHPNLPAEMQADAYARALAAQPDDAKKLPPVLDIELDNGLTPNQLVTWTKEFLNRVEEKTGQQPMVYTYRWFWQNKMANSSDFTNYPLWLAAYQDTPPTDIPGGWSDLTFWQYSETGRVPGIGVVVDRNRFNGSASDLEAFATTGGVTEGESVPAPVIPEIPALPEIPNVTVPDSSLEEPNEQASSELIDVILDQLSGDVNAGEFMKVADSIGMNANDAGVLLTYIQRANSDSAHVPTELLEEMADDAALADVLALLAGATR